MREAAAKSAQLQITGYRSDSTGEVKNLRVRLVGTGLYERLLRESVEQLKENEEIRKRPDDIPEDAWKDAMREQLVSWQTSLDGKTPPPPKNDPYEDTGEGYRISKLDPGIICIDNAEILEEVITQEGDPYNHRSDKTRAKAELRKRCAVNRFAGKLTLSDNKIQNISVI